MLEGDTALAPNIWKLAQGKFFSNGGGGLWFKSAFSGGYPTVRGTMATYFGFPSHPNRDVPSFYASNHFTGFPELMTGYVRRYMTISNPVFDHTLPFIEKFYGDDWKMPEHQQKPGTTDSLGMDIALKMLDELPTDSSWLFTFNTISTHIPFYGYPDDFAPKPDDAMERYRNARRFRRLRRSPTARRCRGANFCRHFLGGFQSVQRPGNSNGRRFAARYRPDRSRSRPNSKAQPFLGLRPAHRKTPRGTADGFLFPKRLFFGFPGFRPDWRT